MKIDLNAIRQQAAEEIKALRFLEAHSFPGSSRKRIGNPPLAAVIVPGLDPREPSRHFICLGSPGCVPVVARNLACGVLTKDGRLIDARRTNANGFFSIDLQEGTYFLRCVDDIRDQIDKEILLKIGDEAAREHMKAFEARKVHPWLEWIRSLAPGCKPASIPPVEIVPGELLEGTLGTLWSLLFRKVVPSVCVGGQETFPEPPPDIPCIYPDYENKRLLIRQKKDRVPSGVVEVVLIRRRPGAEAERLPGVKIKLEHTVPPQGEAYWYADVPLDELIKDFGPDDDLIYFVEAAPGP
jgi:hypothetical protein